MMLERDIRMVARNLESAQSLIDGARETLLAHLPKPPFGVFHDPSTNQYGVRKVKGGFVMLQAKTSEAIAEAVCAHLNDEGRRCSHE